VLNVVMRNLRGESFIGRVCHEDDDEKRYLKRRKIVPDFRTPSVKVYVVKKPVVASKVGDDSSSSGLYYLLGQNHGSDDSNTRCMIRISVSIISLCPHHFAGCANI